MTPPPCCRHVPPQPAPRHHTLLPRRGRGCHDQQQLPAGGPAAPLQGEHRQVSGAQWWGVTPPKCGQGTLSHTTDRASSQGGASGWLAEGSMTASSLRFSMAAGTGCALTPAKAPCSLTLPPLRPSCPGTGGCRGRLRAAASLLPAVAASGLMAGGRCAASAGPENRSGASGSGAGSCLGTGGRAFRKAAVAPSETCHLVWQGGQREVMPAEGLGWIPLFSPMGAL